jgi:hypothetical protein
MSNQFHVSNDAEYIKKTGDLRYLKEKLEKTRPTVYLLLAIVLGVIGFAFQGLIGLIAWLFALASLLTLITNLVKRANLSKQITQLEGEIAAFHPIESTTSTVSSPSDNSVTGKLLELNKLLENKLISQEEFDAKKAEIIKQL